EIFIAADAADMAKQLVGLLYGGGGPAERRSRAARRHQDHPPPREAGRGAGGRTLSDHNTNIKLDRGGPEHHACTSRGTLLPCGAVGMAAWAISNAGALNLAATGLFFFFMQLISMMLKAGLIVVPEKNRKDFGETRGLLKTAWREFQEFQ